MYDCLRARYTSEMTGVHNLDLLCTPNRVVCECARSNWVRLENLESAGGACLFQKALDAPAVLADCLLSVDLAPSSWRPSRQYPSEVAVRRRCISVYLTVDDLKPSSYLAVVCHALGQAEESAGARELKDGGEDVSMIAR